MVQPARLVAGVAAVAALSSAVALLIVIGVSPDESTAQPVQATDGEALSLQHLEGPAPQSASGTWNGRDVIAIKLAGPVAGPSLAVPGAPDERIVLFEAKSTHLGCAVEPTQDLDYGFVLRDICHHGLWDPANGARPLREPAPRPLPQLIPSIKSADGALLLHAEPIPR